MANQGTGYRRAEDLVGKTLERRYRIVRLLGQGGMGAVYEAIHDKLDKRVAVKVLHSRHAADERQNKRFLQEAKAANRIDNPHVVEILDFGEEPVTHFVMEFLEGTDLRKLIRSGGAMPWPRARRLFLQIVDALRAAHVAGVIHRDVKPSNVVVRTTADGGELVKVLDFGIAKVQTASDNTGLTRHNELVGTVRYMSPEQAMAGEVDDRTDVYSAGAVLFEMLAGRPPFVASTDFELLNAHVRQTAPRLSSLVPTIPPEVDAIVARTLEKRPMDRFQTMADLYDAVRAVPAGDGLPEPGGAALAPSTSMTGRMTAAHVRSGPFPPVQPISANSMDSGAATVVMATPEEPPHFTSTQPAPASDPGLWLPQQDDRTLSSDTGTTSATGVGPLPRGRGSMVAFAIAGVLTLGAGAAMAVVLTRDQEPVTITTTPSPAKPTEPVTAAPTPAPAPIGTAVAPSPQPPAVTPVPPPVADEGELEVIVVDEGEDPEVDEVDEALEDPKPEHDREHDHRGSKKESGGPSDAAVIRKLRRKAVKSCSATGSVAVSFQVMPTGKVLLAKSSPSNACIVDIVSLAQFAPRDKPERKAMTVSY